MSIEWMRKRRSAVSSRRSRKLPKVGSNQCVCLEGVGGRQRLAIQSEDYEDLSRVGLHSHDQKVICAR
jgi:hypothetical protein